eukprot:CAMPEP_0202459040 /NCGR_PEP_ID=MMETSP1360-20130828/30446_1 /ASSEMBLY_ACC=CAM_ASM_000848 /TAXON_ID=515479 /ORGANISM="Licmophora paradoxa, Strain CCMP2313" /LENGTH=248 /DNA_ID=CAMNT_0049079873 /DNA_START=93 /DNA_END=839 /DNA_ORIENTATION=+
MAPLSNSNSGDTVVEEPTPEPTRNDCPTGTVVRLRDVGSLDIWVNSQARSHQDEHVYGSFAGMKTTRITRRNSLRVRADINDPSQSMLTKRRLTFHDCEGQMARAAALVSEQFAAGLFSLDDDDGEDEDEDQQPNYATPLPQRGPSSQRIQEGDEEYQEEKEYDHRHRHHQYKHDSHIRDNNSTQSNDIQDNYIQDYSMPLKWDDDGEATKPHPLDDNPPSRRCSFDSTMADCYDDDESVTPIMSTTI